MDNTPDGWHRHKNGGGLVQDTAHVDDSAWVYGNAWVYGDAWVKSPTYIQGSRRDFTNSISRNLSAT